MAHEMSPGTRTTSSADTERSQASLIRTGWSSQWAPKMFMGLSEPKERCRSERAKTFTQDPFSPRMSRAFLQSSPICSTR